MTTGVLSHSHASRGSALVQNIPLPSGQNAGTVALNQELRRFFLLSGTEGLPPEEPAGRIRAVEAICTYLCQQASEEQTWELFSSQPVAIVTMPTFADCFANWLSLSLGAAGSIPLEYAIFGADIGSDVLRFGLREGLLEALGQALELAQLCFPSVLSRAVDLDQDPDTGDEWLTVRIGVQGGKRQVLDSYRQYTRQWVAALPWPTRGKVRLTYALV